MYNLPELPYPYEALEPYIDKETMEIHHLKHHQAYVNKLNEALAKHPELAEKSLEELLADLEGLPEDIRKAIKNHGGGHYNHSLFWRIMGPSSKNRPQGELLKKIEASFGSFFEFKKKFSEIAMGIFGSGWCWLVEHAGQLEIEATQNQDCPISSGKVPILALDIWEHAYYLKYQNKRADYIENWWQVVDWSNISSSN
ncbi:superoxide dismutase [Candidatus Microgenomates bacterium]|nr:superoxide dismutase [Candidatus Microgenomates bacterium]